MTTWTVVLLLWIAPALVLLVALVRANLRKAARRRSQAEKALPKTSKAGSAPAE
jgi:cytochrome c-type biogenesis protein CcmH/NrfF